MPIFKKDLNPTTPDPLTMPVDHPILVWDSGRRLEDIADDADVSREMYVQHFRKVATGEEYPGVYVTEDGRTKLTDCKGIEYFEYWAYLPKSKLNGTPWEDSLFSAEG